MNQLDRKERIIEMLMQSDECITASELASCFGVTRQIIVSDVALLRANGKRIVATQKGYTIEKQAQNPKGTAKVIVCRHTTEQIREELYTVVDNGGSVLNVMVDHPIYGEISADLNISSRYDADQFMSKAEKSNARQLSDLTDGYHYHTIMVPDEAAFLRIKSILLSKGILQKDLQLLQK